MREKPAAARVFKRLALTLAPILLLASGCAYSTLRGVSVFEPDDRAVARLYAMFPTGTDSATILRVLEERTGKEHSVENGKVGYLEGGLGDIKTPAEVTQYIQAAISERAYLLQGEPRFAFFELDRKGRLVRIVVCQSRTVL